MSRDQKEKRCCKSFAGLVHAKSFGGTLILLVISLLKLLRRHINYWMYLRTTIFENRVES